MAILSDGILGAAIGRIGPVTGYQRNGRNILRSSGSRGVVKVTPARLAQREKIRICNQFTKAFTGTGFFTATFPAYGHTGNAYNRVTSSLMNLGLTGAYPEMKLCWSKVLISRGPLPGAQEAVASNAADNLTQFTWTDNSGDGSARETDKVILAAYNPASGQSAFSLHAGYRNAETAFLQLPATGNAKWAAWMSFINHEGDVADSVFCGMVEAGG